MKKHTRTTICGVIFAVAFIIFAICFSMVLSRLNHGCAPAGVRGLTSVTLLSLWVTAIAGALLGLHAADGRHHDELHKHVHGRKEN